MLLNIFLQQASPAETTDYMILGFGVIFGTIAIYLWSLYNRDKQLKKDLALLEEMKEDK